MRPSCFPLTDQLATTRLRCSTVRPERLPSSVGTGTYGVGTDEGGPEEKEQRRHRDEQSVAKHVAALAPVLCSRPSAPDRSDRRRQAPNSDQVDECIARDREAVRAPLACYLRRYVVGHKEAHLAQLRRTIDAARSIGDRPPPR